MIQSEEIDRQNIGSHLRDKKKCAKREADTDMFIDDIAPR